MGPSAWAADGGADLAGARRRLCGLGRIHGIAGHCRRSSIRGALPADSHHPDAVRDHRRANRERAVAGCQPGRERPHGWLRGSAAVGGSPRDPDLGLVPLDHRSMGSIHRRSVRRIRNIPFGFKIGEIHLSFETLLTAAVVLLLLLIVTRIVQRWLETELLPRTRLEPSLQLSIVTIFGYIGAIIAIVVALTGLGFDLQKITLIAGALSVGIGFGLQSIVSNFVSGLILLTERPIRVGDSIVVKGEEGWV